MNPAATPSTLPVPVFLIVLAAWGGLTLLGLWLGSRQVGWHDLAKSYASNSSFDGRVWHFLIAILLRSKLRWHLLVLDVGANREGLYLRVFPMSLPFYPPLFIPWADLSADLSSHWFKGLEIQFRGVPGLRLELRGGIGRKIVAEAGDAWADGQSLFVEES